jgi:hypothetical protein
LVYKLIEAGVLTISFGTFYFEFRDRNSFAKNLKIIIYGLKDVLLDARPTERVSAIFNVESKLVIYFLFLETDLTLEFANEWIFKVWVYFDYSYIFLIWVYRLEKLIREHFLELFLSE